MTMATLFLLLIGLGHAANHALPDGPGDHSRGISSMLIENGARKATLLFRSGGEIK